MKLILTRHGETIENKAGILMGHLHGNLSEEGIIQAKKVAKRLKDEKIDVIYSSDLGRAARTAEEIKKYHKNIPLYMVKELRERNMGEFEGKTKKDLGVEEITFEFNPKGGETGGKMFQRAKYFLDKILHKHKNDTVLFVCHNGIGKAIIGNIMNKKPDEIQEIERLKNVSVSIFEVYEDKKHMIHLFNDVTHLSV